MRSLAVLSVAAAVAVAGCATAPVEPAATTTASSGSPQPIAHYDWFLHGDADQARLAYGLEESDDLKLGLDCTAGSRRVELSAIGQTDGKSEILIESGGETERLDARSEPSQVSDGTFLTASIAADAPVMRRFRQVKWLALWEDGQRATLVPHPGSTGNIERFFEICG